MAGLYIHIPFCQSRCIYCDFYSTTCLSSKDRYVTALLSELEDWGQSRSWCSDGGALNTIYIGGGTPSSIGVELLETISRKIEHIWGFDSLREFTVELNPDDVSAEFAEKLHKLPITRVSMGVQSFNDDILKFMNRRHNSAGAVKAYRNLCNAGFDNISLDLIFGVPGQDVDMLNTDLDNMFELNPQHISIYSLSYSPGTKLSIMADDGIVQPLSDECCSHMYRIICKRLSDAGYVHYEISNFAKPGYESRHNSGYWNNSPYMGAGAGAHSYNGTDCRRSNEPDLEQYIANRRYETEYLDVTDCVNEFIMLSLRTIHGLDLKTFRDRFGTEYYEKLLTVSNNYLESGHLIVSDDCMKIPQKHIYVSNMIIADLFF